MHRAFFNSCARRLGLNLQSLSHPSTRSHYCGQLNEHHIGEQVTLSGWITSERKLNKAASFYSLRDWTGTTQLLATDDALETLKHVPLQSVVSIRGKVRVRPKSAQREASQLIEVQVDHATILNPAQKNLPFDPSDEFNLASDELRARYRYLDLRRDTLIQNIKKRSTVAQHVRTYFHEKGFTEVETPLLLKSTPEGAREFLVPASRIKSMSDSVSPNSQRPNSNLFYALPQSPQQPKQLLICSGAIDKYYQLARCFRDEDGRKDRQPEFTQIDLEMGFVSWVPSKEEVSNGWGMGGGEIKKVVEQLIQKIWLEVEGIELPSGFPVMTYQRAMNTYGTDKPDTRIGLEIHNINALLYELDADEVVDAIVIRQEEYDWCLHSPAPQDLTDLVHKTSLNDENLRDWLSEVSEVIPILRTMKGRSLELSLKLGLKPGDAIWLSQRNKQLQGSWTSLGRLRSHFGSLAENLGLLPGISAPHFLWVTEFPLFTRTGEDKAEKGKGRWSSTHHPFTAPMLEDVPHLMSGNTEKVRGQHYDLVINGVELGGGSVRVHIPEMQRHIFQQILQLDEQELDSFSHLLEALSCGAPPHGGIALGFDRLLSMLCRSASLRDVIAFPKSAGGVDPLFRAPSTFKAECARER